MINIHKLRVKHDDFQLHIDGLDLEENEIVGIIGENGSGKTMFIKALLNRIDYEGEIQRNLFNADVAVVMQKNEFSDLLKVSEIIKIILNVGEIKSEVQKRIEDYSISSLLKKRFGNLSGGEKQKLFLFLATYYPKKLYVFDEMTTALDYQNRKEIVYRIRDIAIGSKALTIIITHYFDEIENLITKLIILKKGKMETCGSVEELLAKFKIYSGFINEKSNKHFYVRNLEEKKAFCSWAGDNNYELREITSKIEILYSYFYGERGNINDKIV